MEVMDISLEDFTWENYQDIASALTSFNQNNIEDELLRQASIYSYYYGLMAYAKKVSGDLDTDLVRMSSRIRSGYKQESKVKLTAKDLDDLVFADEDYIEASKKVTEATFRYELLKGLIRSLEQKKDMLQQASANKREETKLYNH